MSNIKRIVRNPITGEEICYMKGPKNQNETPRIKDMEHEQRKNELLSSRIPSSNSYANINNKNENEKSHFISSFSSNKLNSANSSLAANASSIPLLYLDDINESTRPILNKINQNEIKEPLKTSKLDNLIKEELRYSARPGSALLSPILAYQSQLKENEVVTKHTPPSKLNAPRVENLSDFELMQSLPKPAVSKKDQIYKVERVADLEKLWLQSGEITNRLKEAHNGAPNKQNEAQDKSKLLKEKLIIDKVLTDQLSNFSLNNEDEQLNTHRNNVNLKTIYTSRGNRIISNDNHLRPASSLSENVLSKRCKFNCRIKSPNGKLALRELFGIFFLHDGSMTIYELHTGSAFASKKANALPFLNRKVYTHGLGRRKGLRIDIWDIFNGAVLYLQNNANEKSNLPATLREPEYLEIELCGVDDAEKENLLVSDELQKPNLSQLDVNENIEYIKKRVKQPHNEIELNDLKIIESVRKFVCKQIENKSVEVYIGLSSHLKQVARRNGNAKSGLITEQDFHNALIEFNIQIHSEDLDIVWQVMDSIGSGYLSYYSLMRAYFGEMNSYRHALFRTLVNKLDTQKIGYIQINAIRKFFKAALHPKVKSGDLTEEEMFNQFLRLFELLEPTKLDYLNELPASMDMKTRLISYEQFEEYYNGLSIEVENDADFIQILKNSWNLV